MTHALQIIGAFTLLVLVPFGIATYAVCSAFKNGERYVREATKHLEN